MQPQTKTLIKEIATTLVASLIIVLPIRIFIAQPFVVDGASMDNSFHNGNYLIVDEVSYRFEDPKRGDVVVFKVPPKGLEIQKYPLDKTVYYIKRIIGLPGETVEINGDQVKIYNNQNPKGLVLNEPYIYIDPTASNLFSQIHEKVILQTGEYFVMGDNRHNSSDSRFWGILPKDDLKGRAFLRLFPPTQLSVFPGVHNNY